MLKNLKVGKYRAVCDSLLKWKYVKRDCSVRSNGCYGVWTRQLERHAKCIERSDVDYVLPKYWREIIIVFSLFYGHIFGCTQLQNWSAKDADQKCQSQIQEIERKNLKALAEKQNQINKVSADYEQVKAEQNTKVEYIEREVQKIVERPVYKSSCIDDDGCTKSTILSKPVIPANLIQPCSNLNEIQVQLAKI